MVDQMKEREVSDVATLKALADPVRLAILNALMKGEPEPSSVKEIAAELGEAPTKLYRHVRQLEQVGLILVAETRLVSGIVESRYRAAQRSLRLSRSIFTDDSSERPEALGALLAAIDVARADFQGHFLANRIEFGIRDGEVGAAPGVFSHSTLRLRPERLVWLRDQLRGILDELAREGDSDEEDAVEATLFALLYAVKPEERT
ncbi:ArsR/SmtB family transcription factor [Kitasatospora sp. NPDC001175]|uniref:ArsR/SmtB family transcription factor n=1 Tax=Kitasatospora sp. NPDC001175 TaxID=3157103 RepID=UPI003CFFE77D